MPGRRSLILIFPRRLVLLSLLFGGLGHAPSLLAAPCTSAASGNWSLAATWNAPCNVLGGPTAVNAVTIQNGHTVTVNAAARTAGALTINTGATATGVTLANTLNITNAQIGVDATNTGNVIINGPSAAVTKQINVGTQTLNVTGNVTINGGTTTANNNNLAQLVVGANPGRANITGALLINSSATVQSRALASVTTGRIDVGSVTLTGGGAANRIALLTVSGVPAVAGNGVNIAGALTIAAGNTTTGSAQVTLGANPTFANSQITVTGNVLNRDTLTVGGGFFTANGATFATTAVGNAPTTSVAAGRLTIAGNATVNASTTANNTATMSVTTGRITVNGNATVTGGNNAALRNAILTVAGAPLVAGNGLNVTGNLDVVTAGGANTSATTRVTVANGVINVGGNVNNGGTVLVDTGIFTVTGAASTYLNSSGSVVANTQVTSGTLNISGNTGALTNAANETMSITTTGTITVGNLVTRTGTLTNNGLITLNAGGTVNANGTFNNSSTGTFTNTAAGQLFLRGAGANSTISGAFNRGTGTVTLNGSAAQTVSGTAMNAAPNGFYNFTMDNASGVALGNNATVNNTLTFTNGDLSTGAINTLTIGGTGTIAGAATARHVIGNLARAFAASTTFTYAIGDGTNYTPLTVAFGAAVTGSLTATLTNTRHSDTTGDASGVDPTKSINRYWTLKNSTVAGTATATFNYIDGIPVDRDSGATATSFIIRRGASCSGSGGTRTCPSWASATVTPTPNNTQAIATGVVIASGDPEADFVVGEATATRFSREKEFIYSREVYPP